jgi:hypothetical protein
MDLATMSEEELIKEFLSYYGKGKGKGITETDEEVHRIREEVFAEFMKKRGL